MYFTSADVICPVGIALVGLEYLNSLRAEAVWQEASRMLRIHAHASLFRCFRGINGPFCILCILWKQTAQSPTRCVGACTTDYCVDGYVDDEGIIDDADPVHIKFGTAQNFYPIEIVPVMDDVIKFTGLRRLCHASYGLLYSMLIQLSDIPFWLQHFKRRLRSSSDAS